MCLLLCAAGYALGSYYILAASVLTGVVVIYSSHCRAQKVLDVRTFSTATSPHLQQPLQNPLLVMPDLSATHSCPYCGNIPYESSARHLQMSSVTLCGLPPSNVRSVQEHTS